MSVWSVEVLEAEGLHDPSGPDASERLNLLRLIGARGGTFEQVRAVRDVDGLVRLAAELLFLPPGDRYTTAEAAARAGVEVDVVQRVWHTMGFPQLVPDARVLTDGEVGVVRTLATASVLFGEEAALQLLRVVAASMARIADSAVSTFVTTAGAASIAADPESETLVETNAVARALVTELIHSMEAILRQHLLHAARPNVGAVPPTGYETATLAVGFVDIVDSTARMRWLPLSSVGRVMARFENVAADIVTNHRGRVIKFVGDEIMFSADEPAASCRIALDILSAFDDHDDLLGRLRGGAAWGDVLVRDADCFGPVVALASRAAKATAPGTLMVDDALRTAIGDSAPDLTFDPPTPTRLQGFDQALALHNVRRTQTAGA